MAVPLMNEHLTVIFLLYIPACFVSRTIKHVLVLTFAVICWPLQNICFVELKLGFHKHLGEDVFLDIIISLLNYHLTFKIEVSISLASLNALQNLTLLSSVSFKMLCCTSPWPCQTTWGEMTRYYIYVSGMSYKRRWEQEQCLKGIWTDTWMRKAETVIESMQLSGLVQIGMMVSIDIEVQ